MRTSWCLARPLVMTMALVAGGAALAQQRLPANALQTDRLIVRLRDAADATAAQPMAAARVRALSTTAQTTLTVKRRMSGGAHVMQLTHAMPLAEVQRIAARLMTDPTVLRAEPDVRKFPLLQPTDPQYALQWAL